MANNSPRIVIDTNLWVSFLITKNFSKLDSLLISKNVTLLFSNELMNEFLEVIKRPKLNKYFSPNDLQELIWRIETYADFIDVKSEVNICRDIKDNFLLSLSLDGQADFLITGDKDLTVIEVFGKTKIITIKEYFSRL